MKRFICTVVFNLRTTWAY